MEKALAEKLVEVLEEEDYEAEVYEGYSGRGMYGKTTTGVVCDGLGSLLSIVITRADEFCEDKEGWPEPLFTTTEFKADSLGRDTIVY